ncbi:MAG: phosphatidylserine/phosphatidylglycerophosphate/cardiolipin synthase family protein [Verrucomicrobia subdivision 3 bacterium]|nr:phosphatidylserine/phosphatidylglycerophosphate/cardiolipin synthase family protein [Verrucomicrobiota bacterium]MCC6823975.1 phosphatidylserine/phosphatidylglycerophosphate/cardiolipin synthase family protein [Limisphaerales bacterium]
MSSPQLIAWKWLRNGDEAFPALLAALDAAGETIRLETYIFANDSLGRRFRDALVRARQRGVAVNVLVDAVGSMELPGDFWSPLTAAGAAVRVFNPLALSRFAIRDHRKLLVCDARVGFVGGFNIATEYEGDGVTRGWLDLGLQIEGPLALALADAFDKMFAQADFRHKRPLRWRRGLRRHTVLSAGEQLLLGGPGLGRNPIRRALRTDLASARVVQVMAAYFLPPRSLRRDFARAARRGGTVQFVLAGKSDVAFSQLAARSLYQRLLKSGAEIYEYGPQVLHAKLILVDNAVYVGSANLDPRSLGINYELMLRLTDPALVAEARVIFRAAQAQGRRIEVAEWKTARSFWTRLRERWAYFVLARVDPHVAQRQWRSLPE